jgi:hypothetical protein
LWVCSNLTHYCESNPIVGPNLWIHTIGSSPPERGRGWG